jgi:hypothetical protein
MSETESLAWLIERFGADGFVLRDEIPSLLHYCHQGMAEAQEGAPIKAHTVYGQMSRSVHEQFEVRFRSLPTAQLYNPKRAHYKLPVVNGTALFPWRYAHDAVTELDQASFGPDVSATRKEVLSGGVDVADMLPFGELTTPDVPEEVAAEIERFRAQFRETVAAHPVVVVAYASNPAALLNAYWADVKGLRSDGTLELGYRERLDVRPPTRPEPVREPVDDDRPNFASAPLQAPVISARSKPSATASGTDGA